MTNALTSVVGTRIGGLGRHYNDLNKETHVSFSKVSMAMGKSVTDMEVI